MLKPVEDLGLKTVEDLGLKTVEDSNLKIVEDSNLKTVEDSDLKTILLWRNQPEVRQFSFHSDKISWQEHCLWWQSAKTDPSKKWLMYYQQEQALGVVNFYDIKERAKAFWGFYFTDQIAGYEKLKLWFALEKAAIAYAFETLELVELNCEVFKANQAALVMHKRQGFQEVSHYEHEKGEVVVLSLRKD